MGIKVLWGEHMTKEEYIAKYIDSFSKLCKKPEDYTRCKVKSHNRAMRELIALEDELSQDVELTEEVFSALLENEDSYIQQNIAGRCLSLNLHIKKSVEILERTSENGDRMSAMGAERTLKIWRGELKPDAPF